MTNVLTRTLIKDIKPGDLVLISKPGTKELSVVLCLNLLDNNKSCASITFLNSKNKILKSDGWVALYKVTTKEKTNHE